MSGGIFAGPVAEWRRLRDEVAALERAEHPDIIDRFGRVWVWRGGDLYSHDTTLAYPKGWLGDSLNLPPESLSRNWNYHQLCEICTQAWSPEAKARHAQNAVDFADFKRLGWTEWQRTRTTTTGDAA